MENVNNKILLSEKSIVYVLSPAFYKTGGTELLHQYVHVLNEHGIKAFITYIDATDDRNINESFSCYVKEFCNACDIVDSSSNVLIVPEVLTGYIKKFKNLRSVIWWESVDNYMLRVSPVFCFKKKRIRRGIKTIIDRLFRKTTDCWLSQLALADYHFVQSYYALDYLKKRKITSNVFFVSDYLNPIYIENKPSFSDRKDIVLFNPKKGYHFTKRIMKLDRLHKYLALTNMTNQQVFETLNSAKVYIDFGNHPGKDRFPREAAKCGCCIITNHEGSAGFYEDVPIPDKYKFKPKRKSIRAIIKTIDECIRDYELRISDFEYYRSFIDKEKDLFGKAVIGCYEIE